MTNDNNENSKTTEDDKIKILPDSSWLIAQLDEKDPHHKIVCASYGALMPFNPSFFIPAIVFMETMSRLIRVNKLSVKKCEKMMFNLLVKILHASHKTSLDSMDIIKRYKAFSRLKIKSLTSMDFYIVTEGIGLGAKILTCDVKMYEGTKKYYKEIYFISDQSKKYKSDLARLIGDIGDNN